MNEFPGYAVNSFFEKRSISGMPFCSVQFKISYMIRVFNLDAIIPVAIIYIYI